MNNEDNRPLMVSIWCVTYNHEPYIRQCLEGIVMQKVNFRFEAVVHDDASTDGTAAIVREYAESYPDIIKPIFETVNQYSKRDGSLDRIMQDNMNGKYVALCDGDDYWTDPFKLQKQINYLEENPGTTLVYTAFSTIDKNGTPIHESFYDNNIKKSFSGDNLFLLLRGNFIQTLTVCFRKDIICSELFLNCPIKYDFTFFLSAAVFGKFKFMDSSTGCYRVTRTGAMGTESALYLNYKTEVLHYFAKKLLSLSYRRLSISEIVKSRIKLARIFYHYKKYKYAVSMLLPY